jgi:hypothetical protein
MQASSRILSVGAALVGAALACATFAPSAAAHHSFAAVFVMDTETEIEGRITEIRWANPHIKVYVAARDGQVWELEAGPVNLVSTRRGIEESRFTIGETIRARGNPGRRNPRALWVSNILLPNRIELLMAPGAEPYAPWDPVETVPGQDPGAARRAPLDRQA